MGYCINPLCKQRQNPDDVNHCLFCGTSLLINDRICLVKPLRELTENPFSYMEVFEVDDAGTQWNPGRKQRVMKVLKWNTPKLVDLIERESLTLRLIEHPCIPKSTIDDFFTFIPNNSSLTLHCLIMDKFEGENLEQWLESNGRISQSVALQWLRQLVEILDEVHRTEIFHRDIKPSNIILQSSGQLALIDFGVARRVTDTYLAKVSGSGGSSTGRGGRYEITSVSTPRYSPLEQVNGQAVPQSDFYALGRTFVQLVTGIQLMDLPINKKTGNLIWREQTPQIDKPFADFLDELMAPLPGQRPQTTRVILQRLEKLPQQIKNYRLANSKVFQYSKYTLMILGFIGGVFLSIPLAANYLVTQGEKLEAANNSPAAQNFFYWAIKIRPQSNRTISSFYFNKGVRSTKDLGLAKKYYELAIKYNNRDADAYTNLAFVCQQLNQNDCAIKNYENSFKFKPDNWESRFGLALFYDDRRMYDLAEKQYKLAIEMSREAIPAINNLSRLKILDGKYNVAIALAKSGLQKTENIQLQSTLYKNLGWAKLELKRYAEAKADLEKSTKLDARTDAYCLLAQAQEALGEINDARLTWEICLIAESNQLEVQQWRLQILKRLLGEFVTPSSP
ncbi:Tetratricopeptide (plasmid) [Nostoc flagelliforme CCNUN1]|uniref:non-specific serine/threonine protein kinase n=1 Tax=Nostoc flagelliforme CCNUN1 TaxID=2038116 RepID=A0A2K8T9D6_9NOSO|nr:protein kinase family protein [Nostoc flagelliforme]AUB44203.1 Tetratricopeptide [Nostoc flagelliforme CCNUN1]